jgi:RNase P subunit RPR2
MTKTPKWRLDKRFDDHITKARCEMPYLLENDANPLHCQQCKQSLGIGRMMRKAIFKRKGSTYVVICKHCKHENHVVKGSIKAHLDKEFEGLYD